MQSRFLALVLVLILVSCGTNNTVSTNSEIPKISKSKLLKKNGAISFQNASYNTVKINSKMSYDIAGSSHKLGLKLRIAKGEKIWMSADFLGIPVAKLLIDNDSVHYYNKFNKTYFEGSFELIKEIVGVNVSYESLENLFTGDLALNLKKGDYRLSREDVAYVFRNSLLNDYINKVELYPLTHKLKSQRIKHYRGDRKLATYYKKYKPVDNFLFPEEIEIHGTNNDKESIIFMHYSKVSFNEKLSFPYKVPDDCDERIVLESEKRKEDKW